MRTKGKMKAVTLFFCAKNTYSCRYGILGVIFLLFSCAELYVIKKEYLLTWTVI